MPKSVTSLDLDSRLNHKSQSGLATCIGLGLLLVLVGDNI